MVEACVSMEYDNTLKILTMDKGSYLWIIQLTISIQLT
jgi:hypothetical protein